jgi:hypothetical protein
MRRRGDMDDLIYRIEHDLGAPNPAEEFDIYSDAEVEAWRDGEVFGWIVERVWVKDGQIQTEHVDSCWGYYGESGRMYAIECAREAIDGHGRQAA